MKQKELNEFKRKYFDLSKRIIPGAIIHDPGTVKPHRYLVSEICEYLREHDYTFYTRVYMKHGEIVDIVCPALPHPFIEVRYSEKEKKKDYDSNFDDKRIFVDVDDPFKLL